MKKRLLSLALCGALLCGALAGCGGNETPSTSQEPSSGQTEDEPKILTTAVSAELNTLYPLNMDVQNNIGTKLCYEGLVNYENGEVVPCLAESWEFSDDGTALTFHLKEGVTFHDGTPFNAEAVKTDFEFAHPNPNFSNISAVAKVESIEVVDEYTVTFHYPNAYFAYLMDFCYPETMQNPMTAFNPSIRVGRQLEKTYLLHHGKTPRQEMQRLFADILQRLGLEDTQRILNSYPFTLSGGMLQRLMIAAALMCQPALLVADEATTAIDACNRIGLMRELKSFCKDGMSVLFVTHDLRSASVSDRILVMDRGRIVEQGKTEQILNAPKEDYTKYLLNACRLERREMS